MIWYSLTFKKNNFFNRLSHLASKTSHMEVLTTLLVILTIIQPFICLHPVIIWSKDSQQNSMFLILIILVRFFFIGSNHFLFVLLFSKTLSIPDLVSTTWNSCCYTNHPKPRKFSKMCTKGQKQYSNIIRRWCDVWT